MHGFEKIDPRENLYGYRQVQSNGRVIEMVREYPGRWTVWLTDRFGQLKRDFLTFQQAVSVATHWAKTYNK